MPQAPDTLGKRSAEPARPPEWDSVSGVRIPGEASARPGRNTQDLHRQEEVGWARLWRDDPSCQRGQLGDAHFGHPESRARETPQRAPEEHPAGSHPRRPQKNSVAKGRHYGR